MQIYNNVTEICAIMETSHIDSYTVSAINSKLNTGWVILEHYQTSDSGKSYPKDVFIMGKKKQGTL